MLQRESWKKLIICYKYFGTKGDHPRTVQDCMRVVELQRENECEENDHTDSHGSTAQMVEQMSKGTLRLGRVEPTGEIGVIKQMGIAS